MRTKLGVFFVFSLVFLMIVPANAAVSSISLEKDSYTIEESMIFIGKEQTGKKSVFVVIDDPTGDYVGMISDPSSDVDGSFSTIPRDVTNYFKSKGIYNATAFTDDQKKNEGLTIKLQFDGNKVFVVPDFVLALNSIPDKTIEEEKTLTFIPALTQSLTGVTYSLEKNPPVGASIDGQTGKFTWAPTGSQGPGQYVFDIVVKKGGLDDRESVKIIVTDAITTPTCTSTQHLSNGVCVANTSIPTPEPKPIPEPKETGIASFVDPNKDPQSYVDRYNNEPTYKKWFDENFPEYSSIYEAVGLEEPEVAELEFGECGPGTKLVGDTCEVVNNPKQGGGCLIATATYGSEMASQVQQLRELRDNSLLQTESGTSFMNTFNDFYYSFSPAIADYERENPIFKEVVKITLTPMISSLSLLNYVDIDSETEVLGYGISLIVLNLGMYFVAPAMLFYGIKKTKTRLSF
ncbi:MAG: Ig family protein [Nitrosarchaeum sp.]|nr:Ig family protein [Nitrosarchaeum sp.]